jgi:beta-lactamase class A
VDLPGIPVPTAPSQVPKELRDTLAAIVASSGDHYGVVLEETNRNERFGWDDQRVFPSGSLYKLVVAAEVLRRMDAGSLSLDEPLTILPDDASEPEPDGGLSPGDTPTIEEALQAMLSVSSNAAGHALLRQLGRAEFNQAVAAEGLAHTRVPADGDDTDAVAVTSPADMARLLRLVATGQSLSDVSRTLLYSLMQVQGEPRPVEESLPSEAVVRAKAGNLDTASNVAALVVANGHTFSLTVLDEDVDPGDARMCIGQLARAAYDFYATEDREPPE